MAFTELILGAIRASQIILSIVAVGVSSGSVHSLTKTNVGGHGPNYYALFTSVFGLCCLIFMVTSQFLFVHQYNGYNTYITTGVVLELLNWLFLFASWVSVAQFGSSPNCHPAFAFHRAFIKTCSLDRALIVFLIILWISWTASLIIMSRLKLDELRERSNSKEIELRIKSAVDSQLQETAVKVETTSIPPQPEI